MHVCVCVRQVIPDKGYLHPREEPRRFPSDTRRSLTFASCVCVCCCIRHASLPPPSCLFARGPTDSGLRGRRRRFGWGGGRRFRLSPASVRGAAPLRMAPPKPAFSCGESGMADERARADGEGYEGDGEIFYFYFTFGLEMLGVWLGGEKLIISFLSLAGDWFNLC